MFSFNVRVLYWNLLMKYESSRPQPARNVTVLKNSRDLSCIELFCNTRHHFRRVLCAPKRTTVSVGNLAACFLSYFAFSFEGGGQTWSLITSTAKCLFTNCRFQRYRLLLWQRELIKRCTFCPHASTPRAARAVKVCHTCCKIPGILTCSRLLSSELVLMYH